MNLSDSRLLQPRVLVPLIVSCSLFMQNLDSTALVTVLPLIAPELGVTALRLHMAITAYMLAFAAFLPLSGWLADRFGARNVFRLSMVLFTSASILCGLAHSYEQLIAFRVMQGLAGSMMVPVGRIILVRAVPKSELIGAMAIMGIPSFVGPIVGPLIGGLVASVASWRWIFWMNIPIGVLGVILVTRFIDDVREDSVRRFDWPGFVALAFGLAAATFGLDGALTRHAADIWSVGALIGGVVALVWYVRHARGNAHAILDLSLLRVPTFRTTVTGGSLFRIGSGANPWLLPTMLQVGFGYSPLQSGALTCMSAVGAMGMRTIARRILRQLGFRRVLVWNALVGSAALGACALFGPHTPQAVMTVVILLGGVFRSLQFTSINALAFADIEPAQTSHANTFQQMAQRLAMSVGIAVAATALHLAAVWFGGAGAGARPGDEQAVPVGAFAVAFVTVATLSALSVASFARLAPDAGAEVSGHDPSAAR